MNGTFFSGLIQIDIKPPYELRSGLNPIRAGRNMGRRLNAWLTATAILACPAAASAAAKEASKLRIGVLIAQSGPSETQTIRGIRDGLKELGYKERNNIVIEVKDLKGERAADRKSVV